MEQKINELLLAFSAETTMIMINDATEIFPDECCGFMFGREEKGVRLISEVRSVTNQKEGDKRRRFEILPLDYMLAERYADESGLDLLGIYHSHPLHPAIPSEHDRVAAQPFFSYTILSVFPGEKTIIRSWRLNDNKLFEEEQILEVISKEN